MDCYASNCPFRVNESSGQHVCECVACPSRTTAVILRTTNRTLTAEELKWLEVTLNKNVDLVISD